MLTQLTRSDEAGCEPYDSIQWAFDVHLKREDDGKYHYAILYGNEDAPRIIEFWRDAIPNYNQLPDYIWRNTV